MWFDQQILKFCGFLDDQLRFIDQLFAAKPKKKKGRRHNGKVSG